MSRTFKRLDRNVMGMCLPCLGGAADDVVVTPDPDTKRKQLAEAAEKRQKERPLRRFPVTMLSHHRSHLPPKRSRQPTEESKTQRQWRGRGKNRRRLKSRP
ncbi:small VCP/p97-interacting protein isoform X1 [Conger conger]|uniref:small VCP/p97-interacting protein isoform X1 n=1 Tax=Conger conger TaxID=82655 RepID=UPI002A5AA231|nr:small VCP/p97-interacting protein isoform X1 [Conger conger]